MNLANASRDYIAKNVGSRETQPRRQDLKQNTARGDRLFEGRVATRIQEAVTNADETTS